MTVPRRLLAFQTLPELVEGTSYVLRPHFTFPADLLRIESVVECLRVLNGTT